jgi:FtsH-binding integral membrane protein
MGRNINGGSSTMALEKKGGMYVEGREGTQKEEKDNYTAQIVKLIPAEIVGVYLGLQNLVASLGEPSRYITQLIFFVIILCISPLYLKNVGGITDKRQRLIAIISYCIWSISLGGPFAYLLTKYDSPISAQIIGGALVMLYTLIVPMLYKKQPTS